MPPTIELLTAAQVAELLGYSPDWFRRSWPKWRREIGFPAPLVANKWDAEAVEAWRLARRDLNPPTTPTRGRPQILTDEDRRRQAERNLERFAQRGPPQT